VFPSGGAARTGAVRTSTTKENRSANCDVAFHHHLAGECRRVDEVSRKQRVARPVASSTPGCRAMARRSQWHLLIGRQGVSRHARHHARSRQLGPAAKATRPHEKPNSHHQIDRHRHLWSSDERANTWRSSSQPRLDSSRACRSQYSARAQQSTQGVGPEWVTSTSSIHHGRRLL